MGPPGTGKTTAALILAAETNLPVWRVDISDALRDGGLDGEQLVERLFSPAKSSEAILFLGAAEALLPQHSRAGRRAGRAAAVSLSTLVDRGRRYPGLVIFASRLTRRLEPELAERLDFVINFPFPGSRARREIWRRLLPRDARVSETELDFLANSFRLPGAAIRGCCLAAVSMASQSGGPVQMSHLARAVEREYQGRILSDHTRQVLTQLRSTDKPDGDGSPGVGSEVGAETRPALTAAGPAPDRRLLTVTPVVLGAPARSGALPERRARLVMTPTLADGRAPAAPQRRSRVSLRSWLLVLSGIVVATVLGFIAARATGGGHASPARLDHQASTGLLRISFPSGWRAHPLPTSGLLGLTDRLSLAPTSRTGGVLVIGRTAASDQSPLPAGALAMLHGTPTTAIATLDGVGFYRYVSPSTGATPPSQVVYTLPTTSGTIVGVCARGGAGPSFMSNCERIVGTVRLTSGTVLRSRLSLSYVSGLNQAMGKLNSVRVTSGSQLSSARTATAQAKLAGELAAAHLTAAGALERLSAGSASAANAGLVKALRDTGAAYGALARAATRNDVRGYRAATAALKRATDTLNSAFAGVNKLS
jgi:hypothetical protein